MKPLKPLKVTGVSHAYGNVRTLSGVSVEVAEREVVALLGPSGCGKSTLLRLVCGLEPVLAGEIELGGTVVSKKGYTIAPEKRGVGLVFQDFALFPHLSVLENVLFGLQFKPLGEMPGIGHSHSAEERTRLWWPFGALVSKSTKEARERALAVLARVGLESRANSPAHALSGGQQQRVALARALAPEPKLLLLDEPFSGLDSALRESVRSETLEVLRESGCAAMIVTHDPEEAMAIADRVVVLNEGQVEHDGSPSSLYFAPRTVFAARFLGALNAFEATLEKGFAKNVEKTVEKTGEKRVEQGPATGVTAQGAPSAAPLARVGEFLFPFDASRASSDWKEGLKLNVVVRPEGLVLELDSEPEGDAACALNGEVACPSFRALARSARWVGHDVMVSLEAPSVLSRPLTARVAGAHWRQLFPLWSAGEQVLPVPVRVRFEPGAVHAFPKGEGLP